MPFADEMIARSTALDLAGALEAAAPNGSFTHLRAAAETLSPLGLRERVDVLEEALRQDVPGGHGQLAELIRRALAGSPTFRGWMIWPVSTAVAGAATEDGSAVALEDALDLLAALTGLLTSEFALRLLLRHDLQRTLDTALEWTASEDEHVRRLASEGTRPYLPWAVRVPALTAESGVTVAILDRLRSDPSEYVRRSVANHLNDLSRDDPALVVRTAARWLETPEPTTGRLVRHALRTLLKRGDPAALALLGYPDPAGRLEIDGPHLDRDRLAVGEAIELRARVRNIGQESVDLMIDYVVHHATASGGTSTKTFKLTTARLAPGQELPIRKLHSFRPLTTRRYHPGPHALALQINGVAGEPAGFGLDAPSDDGRSGPPRAG